MDNDQFKKNIEKPELTKRGSRVKRSSHNSETIFFLSCIWVSCSVSPSQHALSLFQCPLILSHATLLPPIFAIKCHICNIDVRQGATVQILFKYAQRQENTNHTLVNFDTTEGSVPVYAPVKHKLTAFGCIWLIQNNNLLSVWYNQTPSLPLLPVCFYTYLLPLLSVPVPQVRCVESLIGWK